MHSWHPSWDQHSLHPHPTPGTVPSALSHATLYLPPQARSTKLCLGPCCQAPGLGKPPSAPQIHGAAKEELVKALGNRNTPAFEPLLFALSCSVLPAGTRQHPEGCQRGNEAASEPSCPRWGVGKERFKPVLKFRLERPNSSWVSSLVWLQQLPYACRHFAKHFCRSPSLSQESPAL